MSNQTEPGGILERNILRRDRSSGPDQGAIVERALAGVVDNLAPLGATLRGLNLPTTRRSFEQTSTRSRAYVSQRLPESSRRSRVARHLNAEQRIGLLNFCTGVRGSYRLDGRDCLVTDRSDGKDACANGCTIDVNRACATQTHAATELGARHSQDVAKHPEQWHLGRDLDLVSITVDGQSDHGVTPHTRWAPSKQTHRTRSSRRRCCPAAANTIVLSIQPRA
jgi:hypothetical protein